MDGRLASATFENENFGARSLPKDKASRGQPPIHPWIGQKSNQWFDLLRKYEM
jgi:hypothetical protein